MLNGKNGYLYFHLDTARLIQATDKAINYKRDSKASFFIDGVQPKRSQFMEVEDAGSWRGEERLMPDTFNHPGEPTPLPERS